MDKKVRLLSLFIISLVGSFLWFIADYAERGLTLGIFGGPVLVIGTIGIPSLVDYFKMKKSN